MEPDTDSLAAEAEDEAPLRWTGRLSLTWRILALNILAVLLLAGSLFYIDSFRQRLINERMEQARSEAQMVSTTLSLVVPTIRPEVLKELSKQTTARLRLYGKGRVLLFDSWQVAAPSFKLVDPRTEPWQKHFASSLDDAIDAIVDAKEPLLFMGFSPPKGEGERLALAPDRTHMITISRLLTDGSGAMLVTDRNARDIRRLVRAERGSLGILLGVVILLSALMSIFLARTIALPLQNLARAAVRVRLGREREVIVPRLPSRKDEIGQLARALSDMNHALQGRIDATEAFAADVAHELKNPLASLASAAQTLESVSDPGLQKQLRDIINNDVQRMDRLITDIADLSRIDAQLARTRFEKMDLGRLIERLVKAREARQKEGDVAIAYARPKHGSCMIRGDQNRLTRVIENLIDNAQSFSPPDGVVRITAARTSHRVIVSVEDEGPGIPESAREKIFERFHSDRPSGSFGNHSGLGLAIAKAIVDAHEGSIRAEERAGGESGGRFVISLPVAV